MNLNFETDGVNITSNKKELEIATPQHICDDMSNLFDFTDCNRKVWADIYCKTGNTLESLKKHGVNKENIIAICDNKQSQMLICRKLYGKILPEIEVEIKQKSLETYKVTRRGQVYWISDYKDTVKNHYQNAYNIIKFVILEEMEKTMSLEWTPEDNFQINNIIMNPPYNNDIYLDFVTLAKNVATDSVVAITPAKHYFLENSAEYNKVNVDVLKHTDKMVFYQVEGEVFPISLPSGVAYSLITKDESDTIEIKNISNYFNSFSSDFTTVSISDMTFNVKALSILHKIENKGFNIENTNMNKKYKVFSGKQRYGLGGSSNKHRGIFYYDDKFMPGYVLTNPTIDTDSDNVGKTLVCINSFDTLEEAQSFVSYINSRFVRYLVGIAINAYGNAYVNGAWRFVPDPGKFDHIFTDAELYEKYDLTPEEIAIIESVIKERK